MKTQPRLFATWEEAYGVCREAQRSLLVEVDGEVGIVYPSGYFRRVEEAA